MRKKINQYDLSNAFPEGIPIINQGVEISESALLEGQMGVVATKQFEAGDVLFTVTGPIIPTRTKYTFQFGADEHIDPRVNGQPGLGHYTNHSCDPNARVEIVRHNGDGFIIVSARKRINEREEVTVDYDAMEYETTITGPCRCGSAHCRGQIRGYKYLPEEVKQQYIEEGIIPQFLIDLDIQK